MPPVFRRAVALVVLALATPGAQQREADTESQQPTFRAGVNVVRVDVSVTGRNDEAVATLDASSFRVTEDGVPQKVETAQFIRLTGEPDGKGRDLTIRDREHGLAEAEREDVRLFALFLDDYHIDSHPEVTLRLKRALESFVDSLQPTDRDSIVQVTVVAGTAAWAEAHTKLVMVRGAGALAQLADIGLAARIVLDGGVVAVNDTWCRFAANDLLEVG